MTPLIIDISNIIFKLLSIIVNKLLTAIGNGKNKVEIYSEDYEYLKII